VRKIGRITPEIWILIGILLLGIGLRLAGLGWGLPVNAYTGHYNPDEPKIPRAIAEFPSYIWRSHYLNYPTLYPFFLALITYPARGLIQNVPLLFTTNDPQLGYYLLARLGGVVTGVMAVYGTYWLYRRYDKTIGLLAAAFLAVAMIHVSNSPLGTLDVPSSLMAILAMMAVFRVVEQPSRRTYIWSGLALGALASVKYPAGMVALSALFGHGLVWWKRREERGWWWRALVDRHLWLMILLALGVLLVTTPGILVHPNDFWEDVVYETARFDERFDDVPDSQLSFATWSEATGKLLEVVGLPLGIAVLIGVGRAFWRPTSRQLLPLVFVGSYYFLFVQNLRRRYLIVLLPFMCLFAATWLIEVYRLRHGRIWRTAIGSVLLIIFVATLGYSVAGIYTRLAPDPRDMATHWMDQNAPHGSTVGFGYTSSCESGFDAPIYEMKFRTLEGQLGPDYLVLDNCVFKRLQSVPADSFEFRFYDDVLNGTGQIFKYEMVERFDPYKLVPLDLGASEVFLYRSQWLEQQKFQLPPQLTLHGANWEGQIELAGYRCEGCDNPKRSESLEVTLCWRALATLAQDYTTFLHLVDAQGNIVAQTDQQPLRGVRPTSRWVLDEVLCDTLQMTISTESAGGEYRLKVGWYDAPSGQRLAVGQDDSVTLPPFTVIGRD
jgi:4-amino-4-deoxy-L-arabinose transferase-like glycosyltransferase